MFDFTGNTGSQILSLPKHGKAQGEHIHSGYAFPVLFSKSNLIPA